MKAWLVALALCAAGVAAHADPVPSPISLPAPNAVRPLPAPLHLPPGFAPAPASQAAPSTPDTKTNSLFAIKVIGGLIVLMVLAYLGGHRSVVRFQERLGIGGVITAGFPFVALGAIAASDTVG